MFQLGGGFKYVLCSPLFGEDFLGRFPIWLICFRWVGTTWMSREVSNWLVSGLQLIYKWVITRLLPMSKFLGHPSTNQSIFKGRKSTHLDPSRSLLVSLPRIVSWRLVDDPMLRLKATQLESVEPGCCGLYDSYPKGSMHGIFAYIYHKFAPKCG